MDQISKNISTARDYGHSGGYSKAIDCNSALGLLALLGLLELLRDIVDDITNQEARKKRSISPIADDMLHFAKNQLPLNILPELPEILLPLLSDLAEINDGIQSADCLETTLCEASISIMGEHSEKRDIDRKTRIKVIEFLSETLAKTFFLGQPHLIDRALLGAQIAMNNGSCEVFHKTCQLIS